MDWFRSILIAVAVAMVFRWAVGEPFRIPSESMVPALHVGDRIWVNKWVYGLRFPFDGFRIPFTRTNLWYANGRVWDGVKPQRWDLIVFKSAEAGVEHDTLVKRIVALPGEHVHIEQGRVWVNGEAVALSASMAPVRYTSPPVAFTDMRYGLLDEPAYAVVPAAHYFVLGDNSAESRDGRFFGWVPEQHVLGRVACVWWPPAHLTDFTGFSGSWLWRGLVVALTALILARVFLGTLFRSRQALPELAVRAGDWLFVNFIGLGLRIPFSSHRLVRFRGPERNQWVTVELAAEPETTGPAVGRVLAVPGDEVAWEHEVSVNGEGTGVPGVRAGKYATAGMILATQLAPDQFLVYVSDARAGRRLQCVPRRAIFGTVHRIGLARYLRSTSQQNTDT
jgi:signal peptidase I